MAVVTLNSFSTASIAHAPTDDLYIGSSAELVTNSSAIDGPTNGHYDTTIMGKVTSTATIAVYYQNASGVDMSLGAEATVASMGNTAIRLITNSVHLINAGHVSATDNRGIDLQANGSNLNGYFLNTGSVTSVSTAVDVSTAAGRIHIVNDGELTGASGALAIHSSGATAHDLSNSGLISWPIIA